MGGSLLLYILFWLSLELPLWIFSNLYTIGPFSGLVEKMTGYSTDVLKQIIMN